MTPGTQAVALLFLLRLDLRVTQSLARDQAYNAYRAVENAARRTTR